MIFLKSHQSCPPARSPRMERLVLGVRRQRGPLKPTSHPGIHCSLVYLRDKSLLPPGPSLFLFLVRSLDFSLGRKLPGQPLQVGGKPCSCWPCGEELLGFQGKKPHLWNRLCLARNQCPGFGKLLWHNERHIYLVLSSWVSFPSVTARLLMFLAATTAVVWMKAPCCE